MNLMNKMAPLLILLFLAFSFPSPAALSQNEDCTSSLSSVVDLSPFVQTKAYSKTGKWLLGEGGEGMVYLVKERGRSLIEKVFYVDAFADQSQRDLEFLHRLDLQSFHLNTLLYTEANIHHYDWVKGVALSKLMDNSHIPLEVRKNLWSLYQKRLLQLVNELLEALPDRFVRVRSYESFGISERLKEIPHSQWRALVESPTIAAYRKLHPYAYQLMVILLNDLHQPETHGRTFQPKPDNILVDLKTWEMTWIDPN